MPPLGDRAIVTRRAALGSITEQEENLTLASVGDTIPKRFKERSPLWHRRFIHTLHENRVSNGFIAATSTAGFASLYSTLLFPPIAPFSIPIGGAFFGVSGLASLRILKKNHDKYKAIREFGPKEMLGLNDGLISSLYRDNTSRNSSLSNIGESVLKSCGESDPTAEELVGKINALFLVDGSGIAGGFKRTHDRLKDLFKIGGSRLTNPMDKAYDEVVSLMRSNLFHVDDSGQFLDQISDLRVIQFHVINHFMGHMQKRITEREQGVEAAPLMAEMKTVHQKFIKDFLETSYAKAHEELGTSLEQFKEQCRKPLQKIGTFIETGQFPILDDNPLLQALPSSNYFEEILENLATNREAATPAPRAESPRGRERVASEYSDGATPNPAISVSSPSTRLRSNAVTGRSIND